MKFAESIDSSFHEAIVRLLIGLISILLCFGGYGGPKRRRETEERPVGGAVRTHAIFIE
jgi:hypothetical protein